MLFVLPLLFSASLVAAAPHHGHHALHHARGTPPTSEELSVKRTDETSLSRMSTGDAVAISKTCWSGNIKFPLPDTPNPVVDVTIPQLSIYQRPASTANTLTINNYCGYDIYFQSLNGADTLSTGSIAAGGSHNCPLFGTVFKAYKTQAMTQPVLVEYSAQPGQTWYDLSLIDCIERDADGLRNGNTTACAGHEAGLQMGNENIFTYQCGPGAWCDDQVYLYEENLCKKNNPNTACGAGEGLTVEFCASQKP